MSMDEKQTILIVDDSLLICEQIKAALKEESIIICEAHSGTEAQEQLRQCQPDLILLDVVLPDADGYELYQTLQDIDHKNAVIIFLTSRSSDEDVVKGFSMGACDYIKKPFVKKELQSRIRAHLIQKSRGTTWTARTGSFAIIWRSLTTWPTGTGLRVCITAGMWWEI